MSGAPQTLAHRIHRYAQMHRDLRGGQIFHVIQHQRFAATLGQLLESGHHQTLALVLLGVALGRIGLVGDLVQFHILPQWLALATLEPGPGAVARNRPQPGCERRCLLQASHAKPGPQKRLLSDVMGAIEVARNSRDGGKHHFLVTLHQTAKSDLVAPARRLDQALFVDFALLSFSHLALAPCSCPSLLTDKDPGIPHDVTERLTGIGSAG